MIQLKRAYDAPDADDGTRVLVDRLWPRGLSKARAQIDLWLKELAPSTELRKWYSHDPLRFGAFRRSYLQELQSDAAQAALSQLRDRAQQGPITLIVAARDSAHSEGAVLCDVLNLSVE